MIRLLTLEDATQFRDLRLEALRTDPGVFTYLYEIEATRTVSWYMDALRQNIVVGAFAEQRLVGMLILTRNKEPKLRHRGYIWFVYVTPEKRAGGIGRELTEFAHQTARNLGISQVTAAIVADNHKMRGLYAALGYEDTHIERHAMKHDGAYYDVAHVIRYLDDPATSPANLFESLIQIPHLTLPIEFDLAAMVAELHCIDDYIPYSTIVKELQEKYREAFHGRSLFNDTGNSRDGMAEIYNDTMPVQPTELAAQMPVTTAAVQSLGAQRTRIMNLKAGKSLDWHRHYAQPARFLTVHLPLIMPPDFFYEVTPRSNINRSASPIDDALIHRAQYPAGKPTVFNSYHYHNVTNNSDLDRISIMMYCDLNTPLLRELVTQAVREYRGPLIPTMLPLYPTNA